MKILHSFSFVTTITILCLQTCAFAANNIKLQEEANIWHNDFQQPSEGISLGLLEGNNRTYAAAGNLKLNGPLVDEKTLYEIGSITKVFTGVLLADAVLQGKVKLEDRIADYLPEGTLEVDSPVKDITLLQLTTHTSGLPRVSTDLDDGASPEDPYAHYSREHMLKYLHDIEPKDLSRPGNYAYSNFGVGLLGEILAMVNETDYATLLRNRILNPLQMNSTWVQVHADSIPEEQLHRFATAHNGGKEVSYWRLNAYSGAGAIVSTVEDLLTFAEAHWSDKTPDYLRKAFQLAMKPQTEKVALGWHYNESTYSHDGGTGGFRTQLILIPESNYAKVSLRNSSAQRESTDRVGSFSELAGFWSGTLDLGKQKLRLVLYVTETGEANMYSIDQGGFLISSGGATFEKGQLSIQYPGINGRFEATLTEEGKLLGTWSQGGGKMMLEMKSSPASQMPETLGSVFDRIYNGNLQPLVGYWSGQIGGEQGLFVYLRIAAIADRYEVTIWSPTQSPLPIGVTSVKYNPKKNHQLIVESRVINGVFTGSVDFDSEPSKISGVWSQGQDTPITLTWSSNKPAE